MARKPIPPVADEPLVTWEEIDAVASRHGAHRVASCRGPRRVYCMGTPPRGRITVEVEMGRKWGGISVDRIGTGERPDDAEDWFKQAIWPVVQAAVKPSRRGWGALPAGRVYASARPIPRQSLPALLGAWLAKETEWGQGVITTCVLP